LSSGLLNTTYTTTNVAESILLVAKKDENPKTEPKARVVAPAAKNFRKSRRETLPSDVTS
jgi:hypothetical protein